MITTRRHVCGATLAGSALLAAACGTGPQTSVPTSANLGPNGFSFKAPLQLTYWKSLE